MKKRTFTLLLTVLMSMMGLQAFADWDTSTRVQVDDLYYYLDQDNLQAQVTKMPIGQYTGEIVIHSEITYEEKIYNVTCIGERAFSECSWMTSVTIPNSVTSIGVRAFHGCSGLTSISIPSSVTSIGESAFFDCTGLTSLTIPNSVTSIGVRAFSNCTGLTSLTIPSSVTSIGLAAFGTCSGLASIKVDAGNSAYDSRNDCNAVIETASNTLIAGCKNTIIPNSVMSIGEYAFDNCYDLTSITIPNSVTNIDKRAFYCCYGLTSITIPSSVTSIGRTAFWCCFHLASIKVDEGNPMYDSRNDCNAVIETANNNLLFGCKGTIIPYGVTSIGERAFDSCYELSSIIIPSSVTNIGEYAFRFCPALTSVTIGNSVTTIGHSSFSGCDSLISVTALNPTPVAIMASVFTNRANAKLYVIVGSKSAYQAADYWKEFKEIIEIDVTGIDKITNNKKNNSTIFTLEGKRSNKLQKGINIINGKKVVVK